MCGSCVRLSPGRLHGGMPAFGAGLALALTLCACGSGSGSGDGSLGAGAPALRATAPRLVRGRTRRTLAVPVGVKQHVSAGTTTLSVTVTEVIDPLRDSGTALAPGTRAVGVAVRILNDGPGDYDSSFDRRPLDQAFFGGRIARVRAAGGLPDRAARLRQRDRPGRVPHWMCDLRARQPGARRYGWLLAARAG